MRYLVLNLDKRAYFRPIELGAPHGSKYGSVAEACGPYDWTWLIILAALLERPADNGGTLPSERWQGKWAGDRVLILRDDQKTGAFSPEDLAALTALGAPDVKDYKVVRENYTDLTNDLKRLWPNHSDYFDLRFQQITQPDDYGWLTEAKVKECLEFAREKGPLFLWRYVSWLADRPGLPPEARALVEKEKASLQNTRPPLISPGNGLENCSVCNTSPGQLHEAGCTLERCPECGRHRFLSCDHSFSPRPDSVRLPWTGEYPGVMECREFGWYQQATWGNTSGPSEDLNRLYVEALWSSELRRFIRNPLLAGGGDPNADESADAS